MEIADYLKDLIFSGEEQEEDKHSLQPGTKSLIEALKALVPSQTDSNGTHRNALEVQTTSIWSEVHRQSRELQTDKGEGTSGVTEDATSNVTIRLYKHLHSVTLDDEALYSSILSDVQSCLTKSEDSDEQVSALLAETLGFEQLDLVTDLVRERSKVCRDLTVETAYSHEAKIASPAVQKNGVTSAPNDSATVAYAGAGPSASALSAASKPYTPGSSMIIQTQEQILEAKRQRAEQRKYERARAGGMKSTVGDAGGHYSAEEMMLLRARDLQAATNRPLFSSDKVTSGGDPVYPHVYTSHGGGGGSVLSAFGAKFSLPVGTSRVEHDFYEEVIIPPPKQLPLRGKERLIPIQEMDLLAKGAFPGYSSLNRLQSAVYPLGYNSNENLLVCAPTGAGKTDVAMLTVLRTIKMHARNLDPSLGSGSGADHFGIRYDDFKIIYVAPMKALASEIVAKFSKRLRYLGVKVRELTGDMQMTRQEIAETQMIVTTPEKWDVVTRKPTGEGELATKVRLLIIDEVHLLHEDRGAVIETIVARTLRLVESSQSLIRIVGLSATLPNYVDVADFLRVNRYQGLFFFDSSFRPVPLEQHFIGVKGKTNSPQSRQNHDKATFEKLSVLIEQGHQMMIFVHARKETVKTATTMREMCKEEGLLDTIARAREDGNMAGKMNAFRRDVMESRNRELKELFETGFGIHHAGMLRKDRNLSERLFETGVTRVLCCTSTLAWGVNLPAYAVLIKGTDVYDSSMGKFTDLSILDVLQIFGRAGRPQYESVGVGYIITSQDKLTHYVDAITSQHPIESKFKGGMIDALNAEVALGSVSNISDGVTWLSYTYLFTRMRRNPLAYGMLADEVADDPQLGARRLIEISNAAKYLVTCKMMQIDAKTGQLTITELGRIAAKYYIGYKTIEVFNSRLKSQMSEADILAVFSQGTDFEQVIPRETEMQELKKLEEKVPCQIVGACETSAGKTNLLLQAYISRLYIEDFALVSDSGYVSNNAGRIIRALLEIALSHRWAITTTALLGLTKAVERRMWPFDHPLESNQSGLKAELVYQVKRWADDVDLKELASMDKDELATRCKVNPRQAEVIRDAARAFPYLAVDYKLRPITHDLVTVQVSIKKDFEWKDQSSKYGSSIESFYVWIESEDETEILQWKRVLLRPQMTSVEIPFIVDTLTTSSNGLWIRWSSDKWLGSEDLIQVPFDDLIMPPVPKGSTQLLDLPLLPAEQSLFVVGTAAREHYSQRIKTFNSLQTQAFHAFTHSQSNLLYCAPNRSGKTTLAHMAIWRTFQREEKEAIAGSLVLALYPNAALASQAHVAFRRSASKDFKVISQLWKNADDFGGKEVAGSNAIFTTPAVLLEALIDDSNSWLKSVSLIVLEDLHCLSIPYELAICKLLRSTVGKSLRWLATSTSLLHTQGVQKWLQIKDHTTFNFQTKNRPSSLRTNVVTFDLPHSLNLLKAMIKPAYDRIRLPGVKKAIVFVPSRAQCFTTAKSLITQSASELDTEAFLGVHPSELEPYLLEVSDSSLRESLRSGIGIIHEGVKPHDRALILSLYDSSAVKLLIVGRESIWSLEVDCDVAILMSIQFFRGDMSGIQDVLMDPKQRYHANRPKLSNAKLIDYPLNDVIRMQSFAAKASSEGGEVEAITASECLIMCQEDQVSFIRRMLDEGYILESTLLDEGKDRMLLSHFVLGEISRGRALQVGDVVQLLNWTLAARQMKINPSFYDSKGDTEEDIAEKLSELADEVVQDLIHMRCVEESSRNGNEMGHLLYTTSIGEVVASHQTIMFALYMVISEYRTLPDKVATLLVERSAIWKGPLDREDTITQSVLLATRSCIPGETLARFGVPRVPKKKEASEEPEAPFSLAQARNILLAVFFTANATIKTEEEAAKSKSSSSSLSKRIKLEAVAELSSAETERQSQVKADLIKSMFDIVVKILTR
ncbi:hypothetical protein CBS101457_005881 [Exobasidium rhododendri]|nr:hypothetical protein CBS101457_005881 [Exobasidium rhododendri]